MISAKQNKFNTLVYNLNLYFNEYFHHDGDYLFSSPGRIELLGNHTDHNLGKVLVGSIDLSILAIVKKTNNNYIIYKTKGFQEIKIDVNDLSYQENEINKSVNLLKGILFYIKEAGYNIGGIEVTTITNIFKGAGVSSSAAFEMLIVKIMSYCFNEDKITNLEASIIGQKAETNYFSKPCGLLDQMGISYGGINYINFKNAENPYVKHLSYRFKKYDIVLTYCLESHAQLTPYYNKIKDDMREIAKAFGKNYLGEISFNEYKEKSEELIEKFPLSMVDRSDHFFNENYRVDLALQALLDNDEDLFVRLVDLSGDSSFNKLKNCYVESINENLAQGIILSKKINVGGGTKVHGGGFAGTLIAFVRKEKTEEYMKIMREKFQDKNVRKVILSKYGTRFVGNMTDFINKEGE